MPLARLMRITSSPAAGLPVVPLVTVPERVWAAAEARVSERIAASTAGCASLIKTTPLIERFLKPLEGYLFLSFRGAEGDENLQGSRFWRTADARSARDDTPQGCFSTASTPQTRLPFAQPDMSHPLELY